jgi:hypothetical protein
MTINLCMSFVDFPWRFVAVPPAEVRLRLHQALAHGGPPALAMVGTMDQEDRSALLAARPVFRWHAGHEDLYVGQKSAAGVLLLPGDRDSYRGLFRILAEQHIPFAVSDRLDGRAWDLVISPSGAPAELERFVRDGGRLLIAGAVEPGFPVAPVVARRPHTQGAWRVRDHALLPSLETTNLLFLDGPYLELQPPEKPLLTLIPPAMFGPPEKVWVDKVETQTPGLVLAGAGRGRVAWIPWDIGALYHRHSSPGHAGLVADVIDLLLPAGRQLRTNAHPLVEITVMAQPARGRTLVHLVNASGHADTAYFDPVEMRDVAIDLAGEFTQARAVALGRALAVTTSGGRTRFTLPALGAYEVVVLSGVGS